MLPEEATSGANQKEVVVDMGHVKLHMYQGDITLADVDVIVNGTDSEMDLSKGTGNLNLYLENYLYIQSSSHDL